MNHSTKQTASTAIQEGLGKSRSQVWILSIHLVLVVILLLVIRISGRLPAGGFSVLRERLVGSDQRLHHLEEAVRDEADRSRQEAAGNARLIREELRGAVRDSGDSLLMRMAENAGMQKDQLDSFSKQLVDMTRLHEEKFEALISAVGNQGLEILYKLHLKGLHTVCIPRSIENDIASTAISFGFNTALSVTIEMLKKAYQAARSARKVAVVEVLGEQAGWIALQAGIAARADVVLIPEIPCNLKHVAARLKDKLSPRRPYGLVVVAEGAKFVDDSPAEGKANTFEPSATSNSENTRLTRSTLRRYPRRTRARTP